jgi:hypothetical protein
MRSANDYEILRSYATEEGEAHDGVEVELAIFIARGAIAWIHLRKQGRSQRQVIRERPEQSGARDILAILIANMIESRGGL